MRLARIYCGVLTCGVLFASVALAGSDEKMPSADEVLERYVKVTGGEAAYKAKKTRIMEGVMVMPAMNMSMNITTYQERPNNMRVTIKSDQFGTVEQGISGNVVWAKHPMMGSSIKEGKERAFHKRQGDFDSAINWKTYFPKREVKGIEEVDGKKCYMLELTTPEGDTETQFFDVDSGLIHRVEQMQVTPQGEISMTMTMKDYREVDGIKSPFEVEMSVMGMTQTLKTEKLEYNKEIPAGTFDMPEDIKKLVAEKEAKAKDDKETKDKSETEENKS